MIILTHLRPDLDAVCSVWVWTRFFNKDKYEIKLVPANYSEPLKENEIALDLDCGVKGDHESEVKKCCFSTLVEQLPEFEQKCLRVLSTYVNYQDCYGDPTIMWYDAHEIERKEMKILSIGQVWRSVQAVISDEVEAMEYFMKILDGWYKLAKENELAEEEANKAEVIGKVAICRNNKYFQTNGKLFERGVEVIVYQDGNNLGLIRSQNCKIRMDHERVKKIVEDNGELNEWFSHPAGFLFCRGSRKAPANSPSKVDPLKLATEMNNVLESVEEEVV